MDASGVVAVSGPDPERRLDLRAIDSNKAAELHTVYDRGIFRGLRRDRRDERQQDDQPGGCGEREYSHCAPKLSVDDTMSSRISAIISYWQLSRMNG